VVQGKLMFEALDEASGLVASRTQPDVYWTHNDSGDSPRAFAIDGHGKSLAELNITGIHATDWEDIALLHTPGKPDRLLMADIGDNWRRRESVDIYVVTEPKVQRADEPLALRAPARRIEVRYEDGARDAETLLADPLTGDLYIVEKALFFRFNATVGVYRIAAAETDAEQTIARPVAQVALGPVTAGDVLHDGQGVALRNYHTARYFRRDPALPLFEAFADEGCKLPLADAGKQGEALCFARDGASYYTLAEGRHEALYRYRLRPR